MRSPRTKAHDRGTAASIHSERDDGGRCRRCGNCCKGLIVEAYIRDLRREPSLVDRSIDRYRPDPNDKDWRNGVKCLILAAPGVRCGFLTPANLCSIYATRPDACRKFEPSRKNCLRCLENTHVTGDQGRL
jgi:Fe-S-cluster containining protein